MDMTFHFPFFGKKKLHRVFVFRRYNDDGLRRVNAQRAERAVKHLAHLFELVGDFPRFFFAGVGVHREVRAFYLDPVIGGVGTGRDEECNECKSYRTKEKGLGGHVLTDPTASVTKPKVDNKKSDGSLLAVGVILDVHRFIHGCGSGMSFFVSADIGSVLHGGADVVEALQQNFLP
jgi:hypothetical protein